MSPPHDPPDRSTQEYEQLASQSPLVSIVTPTLNQGRYIEHTLRSVRNQTYATFEHIVVDGGSTDETIGILERYTGTYPLTWTSEPDGGMYEAVNKGLQRARGEILAYLNSDDLYLPWALESVVRHFARHPRADFVFGGMISVEEETGAEHLHFQPPFNLDFIRRTGFLGQPSVFWRRRVHEIGGGFDETLRYVADCDYWMRMGASHHFERLKEFVSVEREHGATLRESQGAEVWRELDRVRARYVSTRGLRHRLLVVGHHVRRYGWLVLDWSRFATAARLPSRLRRNLWPRFIESGVSIRWHVLPLRVFPTRSRLRPASIRSSTDWLRPGP